MRQTFRCLECGGVLRMCARYEYEGVECWHCDACPAKVSHSRAGELELLGSAVFPMEKALDKLRESQVRQGTLGLEDDLRFVLAGMERTRLVIIEVMKRLAIPIVQEVPDSKLSYTQRVVAQMRTKGDNLRLEGE